VSSRDLLVPPGSGNVCPGCAPALHSEMVALEAHPKCCRAGSVRGGLLPAPPCAVSPEHPRLRNLPTQLANTACSGQCSPESDEYVS